MAKKRKRTPKSILKLPDLEQSKSAVLNSLPSVSSQRSYDHAIRQFIDRYCSEPRLAFNKIVVTRYRIFLEQAHYASSTINLRLAAVRRLAYEAADAGLLSPDLAAGIRRVKGAKRHGKESNGNSYAVLSVATATSWKKPNSEEWETRTEWHRVVVWGKQAARLNLNKGDKVLVVGEIRYREYEEEVSNGKTKVDVKKRLAEIHASGVERLYKAEKAGRGIAEGRPHAALQKHDEHRNEARADLANGHH